MQESHRDPDVWDRTKAGALQAGGFTVELLKDLAQRLHQEADRGPDRDFAIADHTEIQQ